MKLTPWIVVLITLYSSLVSALTERTANNGNLIMQDVPDIPTSIIEDLNRYQNVRSAAFRAFSMDSNAIYVSTRFGDVAQLHKVASPGGSRQQLTFFKEPVGSVSRQPGSDFIAFTMDAGGNEFTQIFILDPTTGDSRMITDGESRNGVVVWSSSGHHMAYTSTRRNGRSNDVWIMDPNSPSNARILLESQDGSWWGPADWDSKDRSLLVFQYINAADARAYRVNADSGEIELLQGGDSNPSFNRPLSFSKNDKGYFFITNQFSEFNQLAYFDFASKKVTVVSKDIQWDVDEFALSDDGSRAAFAVNDEGMSKLYLLDPQSFQYKLVTNLPLGVASGMTFSPDGSKLAFTLNTPKTPSDTFVLPLGKAATDSGKLTRWTYSEVGGLDTNQFIEPELIRFDSFDKRKIPAFIYKPASKGPHPVIISIHGGPEAQYRPYFNSAYQLWLNKLGAAVIAPNVRGSAGYGKEYINLDNGFKREDSVKDIGALLDWISTQPDLDANRIAVIGGSYGGYMVLASAVHYSNRLNAAVDIVGISNFVTFLKNTQDYRRDLRRAEYGDERDPKMYEHLQSISPSNNVDRITVPLFVVQGQNDPRVPVTEAEQIVAALRDKGKPVWYMNALNEGHGYRKKENQDIYQQAIVLFFREYL